MTDLATEKFEIMAKLFQRKYGEMAPGKDRPAAMGTQTDAERDTNQARWNSYRIGDALNDSLELIIDIRDQVEKLRDEAEEKAKVCSLNDYTHARASYLHSKALYQAVLDLIDGKGDNGDRNES